MLLSVQIFRNNLTELANQFYIFIFAHLLHLYPTKKTFFPNHWKNKPQIITNE